MTIFRHKRIYDPASPDDGFRVLVDRLWPRGVSKERADLGLWARDAAPSDELRKWFHGPDGTIAGFRERYLAELDQSGAAVPLHQELLRHNVVTLLTASRGADDPKIPTLVEAMGERLTD